MQRAGELSGVSASTVYRWVTHGIGGAKLRAVRVGREWRTSHAWLMLFWEALALQGVRHRPQKLRQ
jgi:excisionase family DNA binding protein